MAAVRHVLEPSSIAVIGASRRRVSVGGTVARNLVAGAFGGPIYPINPHAKTIAGRRAYASVATSPDRWTWPSIAVPAPLVVEAARECELKGVRALVVLSAGFGEDGPEGEARQAELLRICRETGMRLVGPNCLGVLNTSSGGPDGRHVRAAPSAGGPHRVRLSERRLRHCRARPCRALGALGCRRSSRWATRLTCRATTSCASGSRTTAPTPSSCISSRSGTRSASAQICRRLTASKPVIVVKSGRSAAGRRAASSHTGALLQASEAAVDALFDHAGVIRVQTLDEQLDVAELLAHQPLPRGDRVAIVTNAGGPAVSCVDAGMAAGLRVEPLTEDTRRALADHLPPAAALTNPVDMLAAATSADFRRTIETVAADPGVDAIIAIFLQALPGRGADMVLRAIRAAARRTRRPGAGGPDDRAAGERRRRVSSTTSRSTPRRSTPHGRSGMPHATPGTGAAARRTSDHRGVSTPTQRPCSSRRRWVPAAAGSASRRR